MPGITLLKKLSFLNFVGFLFLGYPRNFVKNLVQLVDDGLSRWHIMQIDYTNGVKQNDEHKVS